MYCRAVDPPTGNLFASDQSSLRLGHLRIGIHQLLPPMQLLLPLAGYVLERIHARAGISNTPVLV